MSNNNKENYILINSIYRDNKNSSTSDFRIHFNKNIEINEYIYINYLAIPRQNYLITKKNNNFKIIFENGDIVNIIISEGNYQALELNEIINLQINNINNFNIKFSINTYKYTLTSNQNFKLDLTTSDFNKLLSLEKRFIHLIIYFKLKQILSVLIIHNILI